MKLNKNGWSTTEMLLLSGGLLIALLVAVYFISQLYGSFGASMRNKQYMDLETNLASAAKKYILDNSISVDGNFVVYSDTLEVLGYIDSLKDSDGYPCTGHVVVAKVDLVNQYKAYIVCKNYKTIDYNN
jgi:hypothetical protein